MDQEISGILKRLTDEIQKDWKFFSGCGAIVGYFFLVDDRLREQGIATGSESWANALFSDFMSFNAFGFVFMGLIALGTIATVASSLGHKWLRLEATVLHLEERLAQIASSIITFAIGLSVLALLHSVFTLTSGGAKLASLVVIFNAMLIGGFVTGSAITRRIKPFDTWWVAILFFCGALFAVALFIVKGTK